MTKRCIAYCIEAKHEYRVDLTDYGIVWPGCAQQIVWDVARREMRNHYRKPVTCWSWE